MNNIHCTATDCIHNEGLKCTLKEPIVSVMRDNSKQYSIAMCLDYVVRK